MQSESDSNSDFWEEIGYDTKSIGVSAHIPDEISEFAKEPVDHGEELLNISPNEYFRERARALLEHIRTGLSVNYENTLGKELRKQEKEFKKEIQQLMAKQRNDMLDMKKDYDSLKHLLLTKDQEISYLQGVIVEQEFPISKQRLYKFISKAQLTKEGNEKSEDYQELVKDVKALKVQILGMKELVKMYQEQTEKARKDLKDCEAELKNTQEKAAEDVRNLTKENEESTKRLMGNISEVKEKYKKFKEEVRKELEITHIVIKQQADVNTALKRELQSAKMVLVTPRLRDKFVSKARGQEISMESLSGENRIKIRNMRKKNSTFEYLISTRASPAEIPSPDINFNSSQPLVGLLPEISSRHLG